jgi:SOS-response transcriptional repressor LexA
MMGLTRQQRACLDAVKAHQRATGEMPSCEELARALGLSAKSGVSRLLLRLEHRGAIKRIHGCARAIAVKNPKCPHCGKELRGPR